MRSRALAPALLGLLAAACSATTPTGPTGTDAPPATGSAQASEGPTPEGTGPATIELLIVSQRPTPLVGGILEPYTYLAQASTATAPGPIWLTGLESSQHVLAAGHYHLSVWRVLVSDSVETGARMTSPPIGLCSVDLPLTPSEVVIATATFGDLSAASCQLSASSRP